LAVTVGLAPAYCAALTDGRHSIPPVQSDADDRHENTDKDTHDLIDIDGRTAADAAVPVR